MSRRGRRRADVPRSRGPLVLALVAGLAIAVTVAAGLWTDRFGRSGAPGPTGTTESSGTPGPAESSSPGPAPQDLDLSHLPVARSLACDTLDDETVTRALGAPATARRHYASGDRVEVADGVTDVVHEDGCVFASRAAEARVWVFTAPVSTAHAADLVDRAGRRPWCTVVRDGAGFGEPGATDVCTSRRPPATTVTLRGLFGDAWLSCSLEIREQVTSEAARARAERWCVQVASVLGARP